MSQQTEPIFRIARWWTKRNAACANCRKADRLPDSAYCSTACAEQHAEFQAFNG